MLIAIVSLEHWLVFRFVSDSVLHNFSESESVGCDAKQVGQKRQQIEAVI